jgi:hypothetical protein
MQGWKECPDCLGKGLKPVPRGVATCHREPKRFNVGGCCITHEEAKLMVGG